MKMKLLEIVAICTIAAASIATPEAAILTFSGSLSGANENPAVVSSGTGSATVIIDDVANTMRVEVVFSGLTSNDTAAHIHCCVAPPGNAGTGL